MMMSSLPEDRSMGFMPPGDEMSEVVSRCLPHRQLWVSNLSKVATQWLEVDSNLRPSGHKAQNIPPHHHVPIIVYSCFNKSEFIIFLFKMKPFVIVGITVRLSK